MSVEKEIILSAFASVIGARQAIYVAGPLASSREYYELLSHGTTTGGVDVRPKNAAVLRNFVDQLRHRATVPVIDPSIIRPVGWSDREIGDLFLEIISRFVKEAWYLDGWEFSRGATKEFVHCAKQGIPCCDQNGNPIARETAIQMINAAATRIGELGGDSARHISRTDALRALF